MKPLTKKVALILYGGALIGLLFYSYALVDPNFTLVNHPLWTIFRNMVVTVGYHNRPLSLNIYLALLILLTALHLFIVKKSPHFNPIKIGLFSTAVLLLSYPFLSHDFFNYLFDAKIVTIYGQNPYLKTALDFPADPWLRFMHWTHRTYPYGPTWLLLTLFPSFLAFGKLLLNFVFFKIMFAFFYLSGVYYLSKLKNSYALYFATSPLVIIEGLVNNHNDLIAAVFGIIGVCLLIDSNSSPKFIRSIFGKYVSKPWFSALHFLFSIGMKYLTLPTLLLPKTKSMGDTHGGPPKSASSSRLGAMPFLGVMRDRTHYEIRTLLSFVLTIAIIVLLSLYKEVQPWYFLNLFIFIPYFFEFLRKWSLFFFGLLLSYYPYIFLGGWDTQEKVAMRGQIILAFFIANLIYFTISRLKLVKSNS